jgi:hypothetical protein
MAYPYQTPTPGRKDTLAGPGKLWKRIPAERRAQAAAAFWEDEESAEQQAEALLAIAQYFRFRPKTVRALPLDQRTRRLAALPALSDGVAGRVLVAYHLAHHRPMLSVFLDALGIAHDHGVLSAEGLKAPTADRLKDGAAKLRAQFPAGDVDLYFETLLVQDPETWAGLADLVQPSS